MTPLAAGLLASHHKVEWDGRRIRQRGYSFDWMPTLVEGASGVGR